MKTAFVSTEIVTSPCFPSLIEACYKTLCGQYHTDGEFIDKQVYPWNFIGNIEGEEQLFAGTLYVEKDEDSEDDEPKSNEENQVLITYISLLKTLDKHIRDIIIPTVTQVQTLLSEVGCGETAYERNRAIYEEIISLKQVAILPYLSDWLEFVDHLEYQKTRQPHHYLVMPHSKVNECPFSDDTIIIIYWTLMNAGLMSGEEFLGSTAHHDGFLPLDNLIAWKPLFAKHGISNKTLMKSTAFGRRFIEIDEGEECINLPDNGSYSTTWDEYEIFFGQKDFYNHLDQCDWMQNLSDWGHSKESAREFFGIDGFLSNLFAERNFGHDWSNKNPELKATYINQVVLPMLDQYFPTEQILIIPVVVTADTIPTNDAKKKVAAKSASKKTSRKKK